MKVTMKQYEKKAVDFAKRFKHWELQCVSKDTYLAAYKQAIKDLSSNVEDDYIHSDFLDLLLTETLEVEFKDGDHQLIDDIRQKKLEPHPLTEEEKEILKELLKKESQI